MTEEKIQGQTGHITTEQTSTAPQPARRRLLKSTVAIPVIMTLHSGAALARTSNIANPVAVGDAAKEGERFVCVNTIDTNGPPYDVGDATSAPPGPTARLVDNAEDCVGPGGILVSAGTYQSFGGSSILIDL